MLFCKTNNQDCPVICCLLCLKTHLSNLKWLADSVGLPTVGAQNSFTVTSFLAFQRDFVGAGTGLEEEEMPFHLEAGAWIWLRE